MRSVAHLTVIYLGMTMTLGTASVCLTVFVLNLHYHATFVPVPGWVRQAKYDVVTTWQRRSIWEAQTL